MVPLIVLITIVVFVLVDLAVRLALKRFEAAKLRREREDALDTGLRLDYTDEAASLKRVEVDKPKARILAVDDEPVVLDSFRRILVLEGYSIDTVEAAPEALGLVRKRDYDFVFTDLKMPGMDGLDLTKAVKHLRPDIDVVMITGYGTIESAVETMKFGAMDYVEKPFTADELAALVKKLLILRQERLDRAAPPQVRLITPAASESTSPRVVDVPGGAFVGREHTWVGIEITGEARIGLDDLALKTLPGIEEIALPQEGRRVRRGEPLFTLRRGSRSLTFTSPLSGRISRVNHELAYHLDLLALRPLGSGWICGITPEALSGDLATLRLGADAIPWFEGEVAKFHQCAALQRADRQPEPRPVTRASEHQPAEISPEEIAASWEAFALCFLTADLEAVHA